MPGKTGGRCEGKYYLLKIFSFIKFKYKNASKMHFFKATPPFKAALPPFPLHRFNSFTDD